MAAVLEWLLVVVCVTMYTHYGDTVDIVSTVTDVHGDLTDVTDIEHKSWEQYKDMYGKTYHNEDHHHKSKHRFIKNHRHIKHHNNRHLHGHESYKLGHHKYSELDPLEMKQKLNGAIPRPRNHTHQGHVRRHVVDKRTPTSVDWRTQGCVTEIEDQGLCGSCFTFSTTGSLEGQYCKKNKTLLTLSEQYLVDCYNPGDGSGGCNGGWMDDCYNFINRQKGISKEADYPYVTAQRQCQIKPKINLGTITTNYVENSEAALMAAVATVGPISVAIDASRYSFQLYSSGIYDDSTCTQNVDHAVLVVGYGSENNKDYWIVKNSWGTTWGEKGYVRMARNMKNLCGIATNAMYPTLS